MKKVSFIQVVIIGLLLINGATLAFLWLKHTPHPPHPHHGPGSMIIKELELDEQQQEKFEALRDEHRNGMDVYHDSIYNYKKELFKLVETGNVAKAEIYARRIAGIQTKIEMHTFHHFMKVKQICNEKQQKKFNRVMQQALEMMGPPKPPHGPPPR